MALGFNLGLGFSQTTGAGGSPFLDGVVDGVLAEYDARNADSVATANEWHSLTASPADGSSTSDWHVTGTSDATASELPTLIGSGASAYWEFYQVGANAGAEGDSYFTSQVSGASLPPFLKNWHKLGEDKSLSIVMRGIIAGDHANTNLLSTEGAANEQGIRATIRYSGDNNRILVLDAAGTSIGFSDLAGGRAAQDGLEHTVIQSWFYDHSASTITAKTYIDNNTALREVVEPSQPAGTPSALDPTGNFYLFWSEDNGNAIPHLSRMSFYAILDKYVTDDEAQTIMDYVGVPSAGSSGFSSGFDSGFG